MYKLIVNGKEIVKGSYYDCFYTAQDMDLDLFIIEQLNLRTVRI